MHVGNYRKRFVKKQNGWTVINYFSYFSVFRNSSFPNFLNNSRPNFNASNIFISSKNPPLLNGKGFMILQKWNGINDHSTSYEVKIMFVAPKRSGNENYRLRM